jgi:hypothetical protein
VAIDTETPRSPGWWLVQLDAKLRARREGEPLAYGSSTSAAGGSLSLGRPAPWSARALSDGVWANRPGIDLLADYLRGEPPLPTISAGWATAVRPYVRLSRTNFAELVTSAVLDRMIPLGWATAVEDDRDGDQMAARIAAVNDLASTFPEALEHMLALADGYMAVGRHPRRAEPLITAQDPRGCITAEDSATGDPLASLIMSTDEWTGDALAHVHLYDGVDGAGTQTWVARRKAGAMVANWEWDERLSGPTPGFTVVRFKNRGGVGDYERHLDLLDRINDQVFRRIVIALYQAFRQRAAKGLPRHDDQGDEIDYKDVFQADPGAFWDLPEGVEMWESGVVDLTGLLQAIKSDAIMLAAVTATSLHYITPDAASGSAEGASTMRERMIYRTEDRRRRTEAPTARMWAAAFRLMGETARADALRIRTLWQPAERYSLSERAQANAQAKAGDVPWAARMTDIMGYAPADLPRLESMRGADLLFAPLETPTAPNQPGATPATGQQWPQVPAQGADAAGNAPAQGAAAPVPQNAA